MVDLIIPDPPIFSNGWMSLFHCETNYFWKKNFKRHEWFAAKTLWKGWARAMLFGHPGLQRKTLGSDYLIGAGKVITCPGTNWMSACKVFSSRILWGEIFQPKAMVSTMSSTRKSAGEP
jgi:hypothetical protein